VRGSAGLSLSQNILFRKGILTPEESAIKMDEVAERQEKEAKAHE
jgi:hypothetical protein